MVQDVGNVLKNIHQATENKQQKILLSGTKKAVKA